MPKIAIGPFYGGVTDKKGSGKGTEFETLQHFDIETDPYALTPFRSLEVDEAEDKTLVITEFMYGTDGNIYGRGKNGTKLAIYEKSSVSDASWAASTGGEPSVSSLAIPGCFVEYKSEMFGIRSGGVLWKYNASSNTFTDTVGTLASSTFIGQGMRANDNNLYIPYDNRLAKYDGSTFAATSLLLPSDLTATCIENKGNYLAIACTGDGLTTNSRMFLWDTIQADLSERVDWGLEELQVIGNIGGYIVGVSLTGGSSLSFDQKLVIKVWSGGEKAITVKSIPLGGTGYSLLKNKFVVGDVLHFILNVNSDAEDLKGPWYITQSLTGEWVCAQSVKVVNDTIATVINGAELIGDHWFIAHSSDGSTEHTNNAATYAATSVAVSTLLVDENGSTQNEIVSVSAICDPLPSGASFTVQLKPDGGSYETAISQSTTSAVRDEAIKLTSGAAFTKWSTLQAKITSTGGAVVRKVIIDYNTGSKSVTRR